MVEKGNAIAGNVRLILGALVVGDKFVFVARIGRGLSSSPLTQNAILQMNVTETQVVQNRCVYHVYRPALLSARMFYTRGSPVCKYMIQNVMQCQL